MSSTTGFVSELVRAANEVEKLDPAEARRLLNRAVNTTRYMREQVGIPGGETAGDVVVDLQTAAVALGLGKRTSAEIASALLTAAGVIRDLHIVLDTGTEIQIETN